MDSSVWSVSVADWDVEIKSGSSASLVLLASSCVSRVVIADSSVWSVEVSDCEVSMSPGSSVLLAR